MAANTKIWRSISFQCRSALLLIFVSMPLAYADAVSVLACDGFGKKMCYSCANDDAKGIWHSTYVHSFALPANFSHYCNNPAAARERLHLIPCQSSCVTFVDPQFVLGKCLIYFLKPNVALILSILAMRVGQHYIRGCLDTIFTSSHSRHLVQKMFSVAPVEVEQCRPVPRTDLFNSASVRADNVSVCVCACDKCNVHPYTMSGYRSDAGAYCGCRLLLVLIVMLFGIL